MLNLAAIQHRPDSEDCYAISATSLQLRLKTAKAEVAAVSALVGDPYADNEDGSVRYRELPLTMVGRGQQHDYWQGVASAPYRRLRYLFLVVSLAGERWLYTAGGVRVDDAGERGEATNYFRLPYLHAIDLVSPPTWVQETVWYQIFTERFANGDPTNDPAQTKAWDPQAQPSRTDFYGGDLQGVLDHLDDLKALGINGLYFTPLFVAPSNHKYDTSDYYQIDPAFGDKALFAQVVAAAHARGMKVMLDAVFNHLGVTASQWQDVLANGRQSRFWSWFHIYDWPLTGAHGQYDTFAFEATMPKLNTANPEVQAYLLGIAKYWAQTFGIDAWRLDVANEVDHHFWRRFKAEMVAVNPDFYVLGEVWQSGQPWLNGLEFDGVMNYPFTQAISQHFLEGQLTPAALCARLVDHLMQYRDGSNRAQLNALDTHDTPRLLTVAGGDREAALQALAFMIMQPGAPCLYYGTEMGMAGGADPDNRKPMDWTPLHGKIWRQTAALVHLRHHYAAALGAGTLALQVLPSGVIAVRRQHGTQQLSGWFNTTDTEQKVAATAVFSQGYHDGQLAPKGFVIGQPE